MLVINFLWVHTFDDLQLMKKPGICRRYLNCFSLCIFFVNKNGLENISRSSPCLQNRILHFTITFWNDLCSRGNKHTHKNFLLGMIFVIAYLIGEEGSSVRFSRFVLNVWIGQVWDNFRILIFFTASYRRKENSIWYGIYTVWLIGSRLARSEWNRSAQQRKVFEQGEITYTCSC